MLRGKLWKPSESTWHTKLVEKLSKAAATCRQVVEKSSCRKAVEQLSKSCQNCRTNVEQLSLSKSCRKAAAASTTTIRWVVGALELCQIFLMASEGMLPNRVRQLFDICSTTLSQQTEFYDAGGFHNLPRKSIRSLANNYLPTV